ncbi:MAG TPA: 50S ribosomal protein L4 [Actinomycetota bacterium]|nr:50S ribosomal protein L4 [Actinomycetota bacterium]
MNVPLLAEDGSSAEQIELSDEIFAAKVNVPLMHQVVTAQLAAARSGTHSTKTRAEVSGGGKKPWRQKGTGRARHGSTREPQWKGGGTVFGPKPRSHAVSVPKKMKALALRSALSSRMSSGGLFVVADPPFEVPKTRRAAAALGAWSVQGKVLVVVDSSQVLTAVAFRNLARSHCIDETQLNVYDVLRHDSIVFTRTAVEAFQQRAADLPGRRTAPAPEEAS